MLIKFGGHVKVLKGYGISFNLKKLLKCMSLLIYVMLEFSIKILTIRMKVGKNIFLLLLDNTVIIKAFFIG
jgi:hypothetical protein